jgi:phosphopantetheine adenylyltransferase
MVQNLCKPHGTAPFEERKQELQAWLHMQGWDKRAEITPLFDAFGSSTRDPKIEALIVSQETARTHKKLMNGALKLN